MSASDIESQAAEALRRQRLKLLSDKLRIRYSEDAPLDAQLSKLLRTQIRELAERPKCHSEDIRADRKTINESVLLGMKVHNLSLRCQKCENSWESGNLESMLT